MYRFICALLVSVMFSGARMCAQPHVHVHVPKRICVQPHDCHYSQCPCHRQGGECDVCSHGNELTPEFIYGFIGGCACSVLENIPSYYIDSKRSQEKFVAAFGCSALLELICYRGIDGCSADFKKGFYCASMTGNGAVGLAGLVSKEYKALGWGALMSHAVFGLSHKHIHRSY